MVYVSVRLILCLRKTTAMSLSRNTELHTYHSAEGKMHLLIDEAYMLVIRYDINICVALLD